MFGSTGVDLQNHHVLSPFQLRATTKSTAFAWQKSSGFLWFSKPRLCAFGFGMFAFQNIGNSVFDNILRLAQDHDQKLEEVKDSFLKHGLSKVDATLHQNHKSYQDFQDKINPY